MYKLERLLHSKLFFQQLFLRDRVKIQRWTTRGLAAGSPIILEETQSKAVSRFSHF